MNDEQMGADLERLMKKYRLDQILVWWRRGDVAGQQGCGRGPVNAAGVKAIGDIARKTIIEQQAEIIAAMNAVYEEGA